MDATKCTVPESPNCYRFQDPTEAHKQLKSKTVIEQGDSEMAKDEKEMTTKQLIELVRDHLQFNRMDSKFYLPDLQDPKKLCFSIKDDSEFTTTGVVDHFMPNLILYDAYSKNNMKYVYKAIMGV